MNIFKSIIVLSMVVASNVMANVGAGFVRDENLKIETLANGLTVAVYKNVEPPKRCSMRLLVKSGSLFENENERGLAHFIEHMAFNGTKNFPSGAMTEYFQRLGMAFGSDTNAHTSFVETVYKLELPEVSEKILDESLLLLRDYADGMLFEQSFINSERSVIMAEMNARDDANYRKAVKEIGVIFEGTKFAERMPIGVADVIKNANKADFEKFYRENYRPDNMVLVVVGDVNEAEIFNLAKKHFGSFKTPNAEARKANIGELVGENGGIGGESLSIKIDAMGVPNLTNSTASLSFVRPAVSSLDSVESRAESDKLNLLGYVLNARFQRIADAPKSSINSGASAFYDYCSKALVFSISCDAPLGKYGDATEELFRQVLSIDTITDAEVENAKKKIFDILQTAINGKSTRKNKALASEITSAFSDGITFISPEEDMRLTQNAYKNCNAKELVELFKKMVQESKVSLFVSDAKVEKTQEFEAEVNKAYATAYNSKYTADKFAVSKLIFAEYKDTPKVISCKKIDKLGITQIKFANGVALNVKPTKFTKDEVLVNVCIGNGFLSVPEKSPEFYTAVSAMVLGGTEFQSAAEINAAINLLKMTVRAKMTGGCISVLGSSNSRDSETMLRYIATMISSAGFREDAIENLRNLAEAFYRNVETDPASKLKFLTSEILSSNIAKIPGTYENFKKYSMADFASWLKPILQKDYLEISIVGDFDADKIIDVVAKSFGSMPKRADALPKLAENVKMKKSGTVLRQTYQATTEPRSLACVVWNTSFGKDMRKMRTATILSAILDDVLRKDVREGEGNVYSPFAYYSNVPWLDYFGFTSAASFVEPSYNQQLLKILDECGRKLQKQITQDEFERAKIPIIKSLKTAERNNKYWLISVMSQSQAEPIMIDMALNRIEYYNAVSLEDVREMAKEIFAETPISISVMPEKK